MHQQDWTDIFYDHNHERLSKKESKREFKVLSTPKNSFYGAPPALTAISKKSSTAAIADGDTGGEAAAEETSIYSYILSYFSCSCFTSSKVNYQQLS